MSQATELIARQMAAGANISKIWGDLIYNVKAGNNGAKGDGVTDDTASINALIASTTKGKIVFPPGEYLISKQGTRLLTFSNNQRGYGLLLLDKKDITLEFKPGAVLKMPVDDANLFNAIWIENCTHIKVMNAQFTGIGTGATKILEEGVGISITESHNITVENPYSVNMRGCARAYLSDNITIRDGFSSTYAGQQNSAHFALYRCQNSFIDACTSYGATNDGDIFIYGGDSIKCVISNCKSYSYAYGDAAKTIFNPIGQGIMVDSGGRDCKIVNCYAYGYYYAFDIKNSSEGSVIEGCTAEKSKFSFSTRKGDSPTLSPVNIVSMIGNFAIPNGGNGNNNNYLGFTVPVAYCIADCYGGTIANNTVYNSYDTVADLDFIGMIVVIEDNESESTLSGITITGNSFIMENRLGSFYSASRKQAMFLYTQYTIRGLTISDNNFETPSSGITDNLIEGTNINGLTLSGNRFAQTTSTGKPLIKLTGCTYVTITANNAGFHYGVLEAHNCNGLVFSSNVTGESINPTATPTILCDNCKYVNVNGNTQYPSSGLSLDSYYYKDQNGTNWVSVQGNVMKLMNLGSTNYWSTVATNSTIANNVVD